MTSPTTKKLFTAPGTWADGASHILALSFGRVGMDRLLAAREVLWSSPGLEGCWRRRDREPAQQARLTTTRGLGHRAELYGVARIPGSDGVACCSTTYEDDGEEAGQVHLILPYGALRASLPLGEYPVEDGSSLAWRDAVDGWLRAVAEHVFRQIPFELGLVGWIDCQLGLTAGAPGTVPEDRWIGFLLPVPGGLAWHPPNKGAPISS